MELFKLVCPDSPNVWVGSRISECFDDMVLGFGVNMLTMAVITVVAVTKRSTEQSTRVQIACNIFLRLLPALGASLEVFDILLLQRKVLLGYPVVYHKWFFHCSQFLMWAVILLLSLFSLWPVIICNQFLCSWWIIKSLLIIPHLQATFVSLEALSYLKESCVAAVDITFSILVNVVRMKQMSLERSSLEESLLACGTDVEDSHQKVSGNTKSFFHRMSFKCVDSLMERGIVKQLDFEDLLQLPNDMDTSACHDNLLSRWQDEQRNEFTQPSLFKSLCYAYGWSYFRLGLLKVLNDCIGFAGPLLLNRLIQYLQQGSLHFDGYILAVALGLTSILKSFLDTQYTFHLSKLKLKLRASIMTIIYKKCLLMSLAERSKFSDGEIHTFMSIDADRTVNLCNSFHDIWSLPLQIGIALYLLYRQVNFAFISGTAITILLIPVNKWIANLIANATKNMMEQKDERIRRTGELFKNIRTLKMYCWEFLFIGWLMKTRSSEVKYLSTRKYLDAWCVFFWATTPTLFSLFTFGVYVLMGHQLDAATVFTCLALFNNLISPLNSFPWVINGLIDAIISIRRLSRLLLSAEYKCELEQTSRQKPSFQSDQSHLSLEEMDIVISNAGSTWSSSDVEKCDLVVDHVTLAVSKGSLVAVVGEVGSGKSSLLNLVLGETRLIKGSNYLNGSMAYVPQVPWILSGTIRDNILFGKEFDSRRYSDVLQSCALDVDISLMVGGDSANVGEKGANLSGGQKARLALARAIYCGSSIVLLDDVLSSVDAHVAHWILHNAIHGPLMNQRTRILCTHNIQAMCCADLVVVMDKGRLKWVGNPGNPNFASCVSFSLPTELNTSLEVRKGEISAISSSEVQDKTLQSDCIHVSDGGQDIVEVEARKEGRVERIVYKKYAQFFGCFVTIVTLLSATLMQASRNGNDLWLSHWVDSTRSNLEVYSTSFYLFILCIFCGVNSLLTLIRSFSFAYGGLHAAVQVHNRLINKLANAPINFFDQTPTGRILNRLSSDLYTIDDSLPFILNILLANFVGLLGICIVLSYVQVMFLFLLFPFWYIYSKLQFYYRATSCELRRLDSISRSPIYASFAETLDGSSTIRAFKSEDVFFAKFMESVTLYQQTSYSEVTASLWLSLRLQLLAAFIVSFVAVMAIVGSHGYLPFNFGTPGLVGLALSYAAPIVSLLGSFLSSFTETEKEMVSVERVLEYMSIPDPEEELNECQPLDPRWPYEGQIEFHNVTLKYMPTFPAALRDVTFTIAGGTHVGVVGRTGAGKTSILNALLRLNPISGGCILVDGINIANISARELRSHFAVVPQSPFLFEGSLRTNLDPYGTIDEQNIWKALKECHMVEEVRAAGGLDIHVRESGTSFSVGQRQLLCLARALLKSSKVLCLDECTANIDTQTASKLQNAIASGCRGMTVITIAHRISTVLNMDNILILDQGILVEQGNTQILLQNELSRFSGFAKASLAM